MDEDRYLCCKNYCKVKTGGYLVAYLESVSLTALASYISANVAVQRKCCDVTQSFALVVCALQSLFLGVLVLGLRRERIALLRLSLITILLRILLYFMMTVTYAMMALLAAYSTAPGLAKFRTRNTAPFVAVLLANLVLLTICFSLLRIYYKLAVDVEVDAESTILSRSTKTGSLRRDTTVVTDAADDFIADIVAQPRAESKPQSRQNTVVESIVAESQKQTVAEVPVVFAVRPYSFLSRQQRQQQQFGDTREQRKQQNCAWTAQRQQSQNQQQQPRNNTNHQREEHECQKSFERTTTIATEHENEYQRQQHLEVVLEAQSAPSQHFDASFYNFGQQHYCRRPSSTTVLIATHLIAPPKPTFCEENRFCNGQRAMNAVRPTVNDFERD